MSNKNSIRKESTYIISTIGMSFLKELQKGLKPFTNEEKTEVIEILIESIPIIKDNKDYTVISDFFSERLLKKYGHRAKMIYNLYQSNFFDREFVLLRFVGSGPGMIYTTEEFNALNGHDGGQILTAKEYDSLLNGYKGLLYTMREKVLMAEPGSQPEIISEPYEKNNSKTPMKKKISEIIASSNPDNPDEIRDEKVKPSPGEIPDGFMDVQQACEFLHIKPPTLYARIKSIPHHQPFRKLLFKREELEEYIKNPQKKADF